MKNDAILRLARSEDMEGIRSIMNEEIIHGTANYDYEAKTAEEIKTWYLEKIKKGDPLVVIDLEGEVLAYGTWGQFRPKIGYRFTIEHSVYVHKDHRGQGLGKQIMDWLIESAEKEGYHSMIAGIDAANQSSIEFHARFGFVEVAHFKEAGYKFDRWLNLVFMQKMLNKK